MYITKLVNEHQDLMKYDIIKSILSDVKIIKIQSSLNHVILKCRYGSYVKYNWIEYPEIKKYYRLLCKWNTNYKKVYKILEFECLKIHSK
jgi:hypothetical protein